MSNTKEKIVISEITKSCRVLNMDELFALLKMNTPRWWSWGASKFLVDNMESPRMFRMFVRGNLHKGHVYIFLNGMDLFDVYLTTLSGTIKEKVEGLYFDNLAETIDNKIERIPEYVR